MAESFQHQGTISCSEGRGAVHVSSCRSEALSFEKNKEKHVETDFTVTQGLT